LDDKERHAAFMSALVTEHYVLQATASATISEAAGRASLYIYSLSSSLVAIGFTSRHHAKKEPGSFKNASSSGVEARPRSAFRARSSCGLTSAWLPR
jgi:hypothetical protein